MVVYLYVCCEVCVAFENLLFTVADSKLVMTDMENLALQLLLSHISDCGNIVTATRSRLL